MDLDVRMKDYESRYNYRVMSRGVFAIRLDGKNFSKLTKKLDKPFDDDFSYAMNQTAIALCEEFNPKLAYTQSDEITLIFNTTNPDSQVVFGGKVQKLVSISAAVATAKFNEIRNKQYFDEILVDGLLSDDFSLEFPKQATFDARVIELPNEMEAFNNVLWRQQDATKNSISMVAQSEFSHGKPTSELHENRRASVREQL